MLYSYLIFNVVWGDNSLGDSLGVTKSAGDPHGATIILQVIRKGP